MIRCRFFPQVLGVLLLAFTNCAQEPVTADSPQIGASISIEEATKFGRGVEEIVANRDVESFSRLFDYDRLLQIAVAGIPLDPGVLEGIERGYAREMKARGGYGREIMAGLGETGSFKLLRARERDGQVRVLFRVLGETGGLNYYGYLLHKKPGGAIMIEDGYFYLAAEKLSVTMRRGILPGASVRGGVVGRLSGQNKKVLENIERSKEIRLAIQGGKFSYALKLYSELPEPLKREKTFLLARLKAAAETNEDEYLQAIYAIRTYLPNDPFVDIVSIGAFIIREDYADAFEAVERLDDNVGGDPYLNVLRGNIHFAMQDSDSAKLHWRKAIAEDPDLIEAYWSLVDCSLTESDYKQTTKLLRRLKDDFGTEFHDLRAVAEFQGYVQSAEFQEWLSGD